ncbi:hypothetical protein M3Y97_00046000 [Aphelenchoides bicaudatus]|nr:hypothetical protein M3Y97_01160200 [Aphelenchoides bicaudatus]KAI6189783.1 hypothetical protein M3Y97_00046000 [Aphelenchoides bicaudatus]
MDNPCTSTVVRTEADLLPYESLPFFLIQQIGESLCMDDRLNFAASSPFVFKALKPTFRRFTYMQICDEYRENFVKSESGEELVFSGQYLVQLLQVCTNLQQILIAAKHSLGVALKTNCPVFDSCSLYHPGGYIGRFCQIAPASLLQSLKSISLNVDLSVSSFSQLSIPCPEEDLKFCVSHLSNCSFNTFVQIGFCASTYTVNDGFVNRAYLNAMYQNCMRMKQFGCKSAVDISINDGYFDLSVETGNIEYSFAYFYYNPEICEPHDQDENDFEMDDADGNFIQFNEIVFAETLQQQPQMYAKPIDGKKLVEWKLNDDLYKFL